MTRLKNLAIFLWVLLITATFSLPLYSQWVNGHAASSVIGQPDFVSKVSAIFNQPSGIAVDKSSKKVFVSDLQGGKILRFSANAASLNGASPEMIFVTINGEPLDGVEGMFIDDGGGLWIAEINKNRVLRIPNASTMTSMTADLVLGQPDFITTTAGNQLNQMNNPFGVFVKDNTLWVSIQSGQKILRFDDVNTLSNGASATAYLGSAPGLENFGPSATTFTGPCQIYVDHANNLWVADSNNHRVLKFNNAKTFANGASASLVLGQPNFSTNVSSVTQSSLGTPRGIYGDAQGNLYVSQWSNNRISVFKNAASIASHNTSASYVIGQSDFTTAIGSTTSTGLSVPDLLYVDDNLWVSEAGSRRVLRYEPLTPLPVTLTSYSAKLNSTGKIELNWQTASETNNEYFSIYTSTDGVNFKQVASMFSKATNGNSSTPLEYALTLTTDEVILAGFGLLGLLLLPAVRNRLIKMLFIAMAVLSIASCTKEGLETEEKTMYIKLVQVDLNGTHTELGVKAVNLGK